MFGEKIDSHITMLQRVVALTRDMIIGLGAALTAAILYFGGDPTKLDPLDWCELVGAACLIVILPVGTFLVFRAVFEFAYGILSFPVGLILPGAPLPRGCFAWFVIRVLR